jgi:GNAT superfamily N-acetyltransferase
MSAGVLIRRFESRDAEQLGQLMDTLGYPVVSAATVLERFTTLEGKAPFAVFVAARGEMVLGWVHVGYAQHLILDGYAEIFGLVVAEHAQRQGLGQRLIAAAEGWARDSAGVALVRLRSGAHRLDAHRFYESMGYTAQRASYRFDKALAPETNERQLDDVQPPTQ